MLNLNLNTVDATMIPSSVMNLFDVNEILNKVSLKWDIMRDLDDIWYQIKVTAMHLKFNHKISEQDEKEIKLVVNAVADLVKAAWYDGVISAEFDAQCKAADAICDRITSPVVKEVILSKIKEYDHLLVKYPGMIDLYKMIISNQ